VRAALSEAARPREVTTLAGDQRSDRRLPATRVLWQTDARGSVTYTISSRRTGARQMPGRSSAARRSTNNDCALVRRATAARVQNASDKLRGCHIQNISPDVRAQRKRQPRRSATTQEFGWRAGLPVLVWLQKPLEERGRARRAAWVCPVARGGSSARQTEGRALAAGGVYLRPRRGVATQGRAQRRSHRRVDVAPQARAGVRRRTRGPGGASVATTRFAELAGTHFARAGAQGRLYTSRASHSEVCCPGGLAAPGRRNASAAGARLWARWSGHLPS